MCETEIDRETLRTADAVWGDSKNSNNYLMIVS